MLARVFAVAILLVATFVITKASITIR